MNNEYLDKYEATVKEAVCAFLRAKNEIDERLPEAADIEERWEAIGQAYLPDGVREFNDYPTVSLGWMMFVGMAVAKLWDEDWEKHAYVRTLHQLYLLGVAVQLKRMGYRMEKV